MTKRPELAPENYEAIYEYYDGSQLKPVFNRAVYALSSLAFKPDLLLSDETRDEIEAQFALGKGALVAANHPSQHDPFVMAGAWHQTKIPQFQHFMAFAKAELFEGVPRILFENTGSVPILRPQDFPDVSPRVFADMTDKVLRMQADYVKAGGTAASMVEGTRSHPAELRKLRMASIKSGIARTALYAGDESSFIVPAAIHYRVTDPRAPKLPPRHTVVALGEPITTYETKTLAIRRQVYDGLQAALDRAVDYVDATNK